MRTFQATGDCRIQTALNSLCKEITEQTGCPGEILYTPGYPPVINDPGWFARIQKAHPVRILERAYMTGEDFSFYQREVPGVYLLLGIGNTPPLHSPKFTFDLQVLTLGADYFTKLCRAGIDS